MPEQEYTTRQYVLGEDMLDLKDYHDSLVTLWQQQHGESREMAQLYVDTSIRWLSAIVIAIDTSGKLIGFGFLDSNFQGEKSTYELCGAYVVPDKRRKGVWKQLLAERIAIAQELGATAVVMLTKPQAPHANHLKRAGFTKEKPKDDAYWQFRRRL